MDDLMQRMADDIHEVKITMTRIETTLELYNIPHMQQCLIDTENLSQANAKDIKEIKEDKSWLRGQFIGPVVGAIVAGILTFIGIKPQP